MKITAFILLVSTLVAATVANECYNPRPDFDALINLVNHEIGWMGPNFFNGADPLIIAEALSVAHDVGDLSNVLGMTSENEETFKGALQAVSKGDKQPLLDLDMEPCSWNEVRYIFQQLLDSGFKLD
ncbi:prohormone-4 [Elysia marginata]|uniref:Prohormone-4 n=1 Tax=Elysia marginata TaxID=1093978 RepID=A0AAV4EEA2_9GAST|nr:prohormone-4 [Elysia marginata]